MKIKGLLTDRQPLIRKLETLTETKAQYAGAPSFVYTVAEYKVTRNGDIECEQYDEAVISCLAAMGLVESIVPKDTTEASTISVPITDFTGRTMTNIVNALAAKGDLLNKSVGGSFHISPALVAMLKTENPASLDDFRRILYQCGGDNAMEGLRLTSDRLIFTGFPVDSDEAHYAAWTQFVNCLVNTAKASHHLNAKPLDTKNDKYTFRTWLNTLGMKGDAYKEARAILMERIEGDGSFKTEEQRQTFYKTRKRHRPARPAPVEPSFVAL